MTSRLPQRFPPPGNAIQRHLALFARQHRKACVAAGVQQHKATTRIDRRNLLHLEYDLRGDSRSSTHRFLDQFKLTAFECTLKLYIK